MLGLLFYSVYLNDALQISFNGAHRIYHMFMLKTLYEHILLKCSHCLLASLQQSCFVEEPFGVKRCTKALAQNFLSLGSFSAFERLSDVAFVLDNPFISSAPQSQSQYLEAH